MGSAAKAQEPTMEEILASIRRIIADDDGGVGERKLEDSAEEDTEVSVNASKDMNQDDIDAMLADFDAPAVPEPKLKAVKPKAVPQPEPEDDDILDLTEPVAEPVKTAASKAAKEPAAAISTDVEFRDSDPHPVAEEPVKIRPAPPVAAAPAFPAKVEGLVSDAANAAVAQAFGSLTNTIFAEKPRTMDELVQEMLRPMLKTWLDENLPSMVEGLVRSEIERISRSRR
jgi:uncharacterized protein